MEKPCTPVLWSSSLNVQLKGSWCDNTVEMSILIAIAWSKSLKVQGDFDKTVGVKTTKQWF